jgi:hypothetical protein
MVKKPAKAARKLARKAAKKPAAKKVAAKKPAKLLKDQTPHWHDCDVDVKIVRKQAGAKPGAPVRMGVALRAGAGPWRVANALEKLRKQLNAKFPNRSKVSDGGIGDPNHQSRKSDHNPWVREGSMGVVTARDFTHDKANGCDCNKLAESIRAVRDGRVKYIIWNRRICTSFPKNGMPAWAWRPYTGSNGHTHHLHLSVKPSKSLYDSETAWSLGLM